MIENEIAKLENQPILRFSSCAYPISCRRCVSAFTVVAGVAGVSVATSRPPSQDDAFGHYDTKLAKKLAFDCYEFDRVYSGVTYAAVMPPSTTSAAPVMNDESSDARNSAAFASSDA